MAEPGISHSSMLMAEQGSQARETEKFIFHQFSRTILLPRGLTKGLQLNQATNRCTALSATKMTM
uniref:Uncharacterized protein n=1 Tax=Arundo donax TaxID=35708 RepID=A0A0A9B2L0_ARUDO